MTGTFDLFDDWVLKLQALLDAYTEAGGDPGEIVIGATLTFRGIPIRFDPECPVAEVYILQKKQP